MAGGSSRMQEYLNHRVRATLHDSRIFVGTLIAFDKHMNVVLADCDEFRRMKVKGSNKEQEFKRALGLTMLRGENIVSFATEAFVSTMKVGAAAPLGTGKAGPLGKVTPGPPLIASAAAGPIAGIGGPQLNAMAPSGMGGVRLGNLAGAKMPPPPGL